MTERPERRDRFPDARAGPDAPAADESRAWEPAADRSTLSGTTEPTRTGIVSTQPHVVPVRPEPLVTQPPPDLTVAVQPYVPPPAPDGSTGATMPGVVSPAAMARLVASSLPTYAPEAGREDATGDYATGRPSPGRGRALRRFVLVTVVVLGLSVVVGLGGLWVVRFVSSHSGAVAPDQSPGVGPTLESAAPTTTASVDNSRVAPVITRLDANGTTVTLQWTDQSQGEAQFIVVHVTGPTEGDALRTLPPGTTEVTIDSLDPATRPYCFRIIAVVDRERVPSDERCAE